ncbi:neuronal PAS domain-containing protein 4-like [Carettochelys insculpta]|uniref:neuronal PAS domain-containing protein 4-like n=1 Tax=Carettochelys insculpta TaxID=44489 RepID=UPI003EC152D3
MMEKSDSCVGGSAQARTMTIFCDHCSRPLRKEMSHPRGKRGIQASAPKPFRSTKGASKARRDQINAELQTLRSLLPISAQDKERISYLHTMALVCLHIRGAKIFPSDSSECAPATTHLELLSSLPGFIIALSADGKLAYISENVAHLLGFSVVELLAQGDSIFDLLDGSSHEAVQEKLHSAQEQPGTEIVFVSEMRTSRSFRLRYGGNRAVAVKGRFLTLHGMTSSSILTFVGFCTPIAQLSDYGGGISYDAPFQTQHTLDMKITDVTESVIYHLGYRREELIGQSWYSLLHPTDVPAAAAQHESLICDTQKCNQHLIVRLLCKDLSWSWMQIIASKEYERGSEIISCNNFCLSEQEAQYLQGQNPWHKAISAVALSPRQYAREKEHKTLPRILNSFPQETAIHNQAPFNCSPCQLPNGQQEEMLPASLQLPSISSFPTPILGAGLPSQEAGDPILPAEQKHLSCPFSVYKSLCGHPFSNPCVLCSPEVPFSPGSSPSIDACPVPVGGKSPGMPPAAYQSSETEKWAISVLAEQIHSLAESLSQYTKQVQPETPNVSLWSEQPTNSQLGSGQDWGNSGTVTFAAEPCLDGDIITSILRNLLETGGPNSPTPGVGSSPNLLPFDSEPQSPPFQLPTSPAATCPDQSLSLQPLTTCLSFESCTSDALWDGDTGARQPAAPHRNEEASG